LPNKILQNNTVKATYTYLADGTKLSAIATTVIMIPSYSIKISGFMYLGSMVYKLENSGLALESTSFGGGRVNKTNNTYDINYFITDHLGSTRVIVDNTGNIKEQNDYYPFGMRHNNSLLMVSTNRWGYNGKEKQTIYDLGFLDYGARMNDVFLCRWFVPDPLQEKYYSLSSYNFCANNPLRYIDPFGLAYRTTTDSTGNYNGFEWVDDAEAYDEDGNLLDGYFEKAILFRDNDTWNIGTFQNGKYVSYNIGSSTAIVYDYKETKNEDGTITRNPTTTEYGAMTSPSDPSMFGTIAKNQLLQAVRHKHLGKYMALQMQTLSGSADIPSAGINPSSKKNYVRGANIHKPGASNSTGTYLKNIDEVITINFIFFKFSVKTTSQRYSGISEGCFLIDITKWDNFISHFPKGVGKIGVINK
jgi:RHS repeat-associated protein